MHPDNPAKVIVKAESVGLRALVDLLRERVNKDTKNIHTRALTKLRGAMDEWRASKQKGNPNFFSVTKQEKYLRFDELDFIWQSTARYGNTENKRMRSEKDGPVGYLNKLLNIHGAILRDYAVCLYPMPTPEEIGHRGTVPIWGYEGNNKLGLVETAHGPTLPELDFIDMIRSHGRHLCAKAFISRVEPKEFSKYALLQVRRLSAFLDYVYTGGDAGHWGFKRPRNRAAKRRQQGPHADKILSELVSEMEALYDSRIQPPPKPSSTYTRRSEDPDISFFENLIDELHDSESDDIAMREYHQIWMEFLEELLTEEEINDEGDKEKSKAKLTDADACRIHEEIANKARYEGLKCHERLSFGLPQPFNLESSFLEGDKFTEEGDDFLVIAETPVMTENGKGRVDLIVLRRQIIPRPTHMDEVDAYVPVGVFEIKTVTGFDLEIKTDTPRTAKKDDELPVIPKFITRKRPLTEKEWQAALDATPQSNARKQLQYYHSAVKKGYNKYLQADCPIEPISGVFLVDTQGDIQEVGEGIISVIRQLCTGKEITSIPRDCSRAIISPIECESRIALVLERSALENLTTIAISGSPLEVKQTFNPFDQPVSGQTENQDAYTLYVDARSSSTSGKSAAWIARYWNGLHYLHRLAGKKKEPQVIWLDLAGILSNPKLAHTRLRMSEQDEIIQEFFKSIDVKDFSHQVNGYLYDGEYPPDIHSIVAGERKLNCDTIVVVSGWDWVRDSTPPRLVKALGELERLLATDLQDEDCDVLWFKKAVPSEHTSGKYLSRAVHPFYDSSSHRHYVTDIVWDLPLRPYAFHQKAPMLDDVRIMIEQSENKVISYFAEVPPLEGWTARFRSKQWAERETSSKGTSLGRGLLTAHSLIDDRSNRDLRLDLLQDSLELVPFLRENFKQDERNKYQFTPLSVEYRSTEPSSSGGIMSRVRYRARIKANGHGRSYAEKLQVIPEKEITRARRYRNDKIHVKPVTQIYRPPDVVRLAIDSINEAEVQRKELRRLRRTVTFLSRRVKSEDYLWERLTVTLSSCLKTATEDEPLKALKKVVSILKKDELCNDTWRLLEWHREKRLGDGLLPEASKRTHDILESRPHIATLYGNYLFLFLVAIKVVHPGLKEVDIETLWDVLRSWQLYHLGFELKDKDKRKRLIPKFDMRSVWSNLNKRAKELVATPVPVQTQVRHGLLLDCEDQGCWLFLQNRYDKTKLVNGYWEDRIPVNVRGAFSWTTNAHNVMAASLEKAMSTEFIHNIMVGTLDGIEYLWVLADGEWELGGEVKIIRRKKDAISQIRGMRINYPSKSSIEQPRGAAVPPGLEARVKGTLEEIGEDLRDVIPVECILSIDGLGYLVEFERKGKTVDTRRVQRTSEVLSLLRRPVVEGVPLQSSVNPNQYLTWDPYQDIEFEQLPLLKPYVFRKEPYIEIDAPLPLTCVELLSAEEVPLNLTVTHVEENCPVLKGINQHGTCWQVDVPTSCKDERLRDMFREPVDTRDILSMMESKRFIFEQYLYKVKLKFQPDPSTREGFVFREEWKIAKHLGLPQVPVGSFWRLDSETLRGKFHRSKGALEISFESSITGEWRNRTILFTFTEMIGSEDVDPSVEVAKERVKDVVKPYFNCDEEEWMKKLVNHRYVMRKIEELVPKIIFAELGEEGGVDLLKRKVEYHRELTSADPLEQGDLAEALVEYAQVLLIDGSFSAARNHVNEAISIYEKQLEKWGSEDTRLELEAAREVLKQIEDSQ